MELLVLAIINLGIIIAINTFSKKCREEKTPALKIYTILLSLSTLILVTVSFSKLYIYIWRFGLTRLRVLSAWAMAVIGIVFLIIILKQFIGKLPVIRAIVICSVLMFAVLGFGRVDRQIARFNIEMYKAGYHKELDVWYLIYDLNDDALVYILENNEVKTLQNAKQPSRWYIEDVHQSIMWQLEYRDEYSFYNLSSAKLKKYVPEEEQTD